MTNYFITTFVALVADRTMCGLKKEKLSTIQRSLSVRFSGSTAACPVLVAVSRPYLVRMLSHQLRSCPAVEKKKKIIIAIQAYTLMFNGNKQKKKKKKEHNIDKMVSNLVYSNRPDIHPHHENLVANLINNK